jgi:hypothetical protein
MNIIFIKSNRLDLSKIATDVREMVPEIRNQRNNIPCHNSVSPNVQLVIKILLCKCSFIL